MTNTPEPPHGDFTPSSAVYDANLDYMKY